MGDQDTVSRLSAEAELDSLKVENASLRKRVTQLENTLKLHAGDCYSLNNEVETLIEQRDDEFARAQEAEALLESTRKSMDIQVEAGIKAAFKVAELMARIKELEEPYVYVDRA